MILFFKLHVIKAVTVTEFFSVGFTRKHLHGNCELDFRVIMYKLVLLISRLLTHVVYIRLPYFTVVISSL